LLELANARGVSLAALSALISRNGTYLQQFVRKGSPRKLEESDRRTLARFFDVAETQLGGMEEKSSTSPESRAGKSPRPDWVDVPRLALGASAGAGAMAGAMAGEEQPIGAFRFSTQWIRQQGLDPAQLTAIAVTGDSMEPTLRDGDEILVDRSGYRTGRALRDGIYVVRVGDALLVKRLDLGQPGHIVLISDNQVYRPFTLAPEEMEVIGRVVWKSGRL
jgi:phage repressor protein C with HTH and peptisase S24 domain